MGLVFNSETNGDGKEFTGEGPVIFEAKAPGTDAWPTGVTLKLQKRSPFKGEESVWKDLGEKFTFTDEGTVPEIKLIKGQKYRFVSSAAGVQCWMHAVTSVTKIDGVR